MADPNEEPKIIVDDDWKSQVEKEKEAIQKEIEPEPSAAGPESQEFPPASFSVLVSLLSTQAMAAMGFLPDPTTGQPNPNLDAAKHFIDTLGILQEKTKGNLEDEESNMLRDALHQLRMLFVSATTEAKSPQPSEEPKKSSIELP